MKEKEIKEMVNHKKLAECETESVELLIATLKEVRIFLTENSMAGGPSITPMLNKIDKAISLAS